MDKNGKIVCVKVSTFSLVGNLLKLKHYLSEISTLKEVREKEKIIKIFQPTQILTTIFTTTSSIAISTYTHIHTMSSVAKQAARKVDFNKLVNGLGLTGTTASSLTAFKKT